MTKPLLQIALDASELEVAIASLSPISHLVDVIEVGTILAFSTGVHSIRRLREIYPDHIIVCDMKITDASAILTRMALENGANWVTVSAAAHMATLQAAKKVTNEMGGEIQIELYGNWTLADAQAWMEIGITQAIYHRSRDAELAGKTWTENDLMKMHQLSEIGIELSITGGITPEHLSLFQGLNVKSFIAGRTLVAEKGKEMAEAFHQAIAENWG